MNSINERLVLLRKTLGLPMDKFGEKVGVSRSVIKNLEYNLTEPKPLFLQQICKAYNVDPYWLETGEGDMFMPEDEEAELLKYAAEMLTNKELTWIKQLNMTLMKMSPEELAVMEKFARLWLEQMGQQ